MKLLIRTIFWLILIYVVLIVLEYARQGFINDISLQKVDVSSEALIKEPIYLISYADGDEHVYRNQNALDHYAINKGIDFILNYKKKHLDQAFIRKNQEIFNESKGAGMWLWKPYVILETMKKAPEGSIILYLDSAFIIKQPIYELIKHLDNHDVVLTHDRDRKNGSYIKGDSFALMNCKSEECRNGPLVWASVIVLRNSEVSRSFIEKWLKSAEDIKILSDKNYGIYPNYQEFKWHHFDQSVLSLVYYHNSAPVKLLEANKTLSMFSWFHRKNSPSSPNKAFYTLYGADPVINFSTKGKVLPSTALLNTTPLVTLRKWYIENFD